MASLEQSIDTMLKGFSDDVKGMIDRGAEDRARIKLQSADRLAGSTALLFKALRNRGLVRKHPDLVRLMSLCEADIRKLKK